MAKRTTRRGKRKAGGGTAWFGKIGRWCATACFAVGCFVASHYVYDYLKDVDWGKLGPLAETKALPGDEIREKKEEIAEAIEEKASALEKKLKDIDLPDVAKAEPPKAEPKAGKASEAPAAKPAAGPLEIPKLMKKRTEQVIRHEGYTVSYNSDYRIANWVAYELTRAEAKSKKHARSNKFVPDPAVKGVSALNEDYSRTGFDKGHMAPAGDMKWSAKAMRESFYFSNICPQEPGLNRGIWRELEEQCRLWASENGRLYVVTGPVMTEPMRRLGKNRVGVPVAFYKVICTVSNGKYEAVGFLFENRDYKKKETLKKQMVPVDRVEEVTGIDFFPALPDDVEKRIEARVNPSAWSF